MSERDFLIFDRGRARERRLVGDMVRSKRHFGLAVLSRDCAFTIDANPFAVCRLYVFQRAAKS